MIFAVSFCACATNQKYIVEPPHKENIIKIMEPTTIKTKISKPTKSFPFCRKLSREPDKKQFTYSEQFANLFYLLAVPIDFIVLPYTAIYDLSSHYLKERGVNLNLEGQLINDSGVPMQNSLIIIHPDTGHTIYTDSNGVFKAEFRDLVIPNAEEMNIVLVFQEINDNYFEGFDKGQNISVKSPFEINYLIDFLDSNKVIVTRKDKYLKVVTPDDGWDSLKYETKSVKSKFSTIVISDINFYSEKNKESEKWGDEFQFKEVQNWKKINFKPAESLSCKENGYELKDVKKLIKRKVKLNRIKRMCSLISNQKKAEWGKYKFTWQEALRWSKDFSPDKAAEWKKAGFNYKEAVKWFRDFSPEEARKWKRKKFTVEEANEWRRFYNPSSALKIKKNCSKTNSLQDLFQANPYTVKDKCYEFVGETFQIITKTTALFMQSGKVFYIDFKNNPAPNAWFNGIVKGEGVYAYTTSFGVSKKVPKLKMIVQK